MTAAACSCSIVDEPGFELEVNPSPPASHLYQRHRQPHNIPVHSNSLCYLNFSKGWYLFAGGQRRNIASVSSFAKYLILYHFINTQHHIKSACTRLNR